LSTAFWAYSDWKTRPSGEKVPTDRSYCEEVEEGDVK
jgi:hypothetical protein